MSDVHLPAYQWVIMGGILVWEAWLGDTKVVAANSTLGLILNLVVATYQKIKGSPK